MLSLQRGRKLPWPADAWEAEGQSPVALRSYGNAVTVKNLRKDSMRQQLKAFDAGVVLISSRGATGLLTPSGNACEDAIDLDRSRKLAIVEAPTVLDRCRLMVNAALGDPSQNDGKDDGKTRALRAEHQARQRLSEAVDD